MTKPRDPIGSSDKLGWVCFVVAMVMMVVRRTKR